MIRAATRLDLLGYFVTRGCALATFDRGSIRAADPEGVPLLGAR